MNYVFLSPHFPSNFKSFTLQMARRGIRVLGIGSESYDRLDPELRAHLQEYYYVPDMENDEDLLRACGYFTFKYGKIDRIESHNEHWLEADARLRTDFNIFGLKSADMARIKHKSAMKEIFRRIGVPVARGRVVRSLEEALALSKEVGYPLIAKPDSGVGASHTYRLENDDDLLAFFSWKPGCDYMMEEYIQGQIQTFDGLTDKEGRVVFMNSFVYGGGVMDTVNEDLDMYLYARREIPEDIQRLGLLILGAFAIRERFFHIEFFRTEEGGLIALEINVRPPGGYCLDIINFAHDADIYLEYAKLLKGEALTFLPQAPYACIYVGVKYREGLIHRHYREEVLERYRDLILFHTPVAPILSAAMGDYAYFLRHEDTGPLLEAAKYIMEGNSP